MTSFGATRPCFFFQAPPHSHYDIFRCHPALFFFSNIYTHTIYTYTYVYHPPTHPPIPPPRPPTPHTVRTITSIASRTLSASEGLE
jgi:hypothetical protein